MADIHQIFLKIVEFSKKELPEEIKTAREEYEKEIQPKVSADKEDIEYDFLSWFALSREMTGSKITPAEAYYYKYLYEMPDDEFEAVERLTDCKDSVYEVVERQGKKYGMKDLYTEETLRVKIKDLDVPLKPGEIVGGILVEVSDRNHAFHGGMNIYSPEVKEKVAEEKRKKQEFASIQHKKFLEYFHCSDPEFKSMKEAYEANIRFMEWYNKQRALELGIEPLKLGIPEFETEEEFERVGLVCTEAGICTVPNYGNIKDLFTGNYKKVPDFENLLYAVAEEEAYVPSEILKTLMMENKESCVEVFKKVYGIETFDKAIHMVRQNREDFDQKELPKVIDVKSLNAGKKKVENAKKFFLSMSCRKCGKEFRCDEQNLIDNVHLCETCLEKNEDDLKEFEKLVKNLPKDFKNRPEDVRIMEALNIMNKIFFDNNWDAFIESAKEMHESLKDKTSKEEYEEDDFVRMIEKAKENSSKAIK